MIEQSLPIESLAMADATAVPGRMMNRAAATRRSATWAAWADALGFPTEFARDRGHVANRVGAEQVESSQSWRRRVGGRMGVDVDLPAGMYSDDTQLRLAVARCIRGAGRFDVEVFSKIELPVFLSYGFGIGRGTRAAAQALTKRSIRWYSNFYDTRSARYLDGGGNGAAMRIQPHVWAAPRLDDPRQFLPNVIRDSVATHGHVRGILGAAFHAAVLGATLHDGAPPEPKRWSEFAQALVDLGDFVADDEVLAERWLPVWEEKSRQTFDGAVAGGIEELLQLLSQAQKASTGTGTLETRYAELADAIGGRMPASRGSGAICAVLSLWLAHCGAHDPAAAIRCAANLIGSDTDTVASMTGALVGVGALDELPGPLVDQALIASEAERLAALASGEVTLTFPHPDPLTWQAPKTQADTLGTLGAQLILAGLGPVREKSEPLSAADGALWQWIQTQYGQTLLVKRRDKLPGLPAYAAPQPRLALAAVGDDAALSQEQQTLPTDPPEPGVRPTGPKEVATPPAAPVRRLNTDTRVYPEDVREGVALVVRSRFERILTARLLMHYAQEPDGTVKAAVFAALLAEALRANDPATGGN